MICKKYFLALLLVCLFFLAAGPLVRISTVDEKTVVGALDSLKDGQILLTGPAAKVALEDVVLLEPVAAENTKPAVAQPKGPHKLSGKVIGTEGSFEDDANFTKDKAFDGNMDTYFDAPKASRDDAWVGLDLGSPQVITEIKFAPRKDPAPMAQKRMVGGKFEASSTPDFSKDVVALHTIAKRPNRGQLTSVSINNKTPFRYVRYAAPEEGCGNIAELEFWGFDPASGPTTSNNPQKSATQNTISAPSTHPVVAATTQSDGSSKLAVFFGDEDRIEGAIHEWTDQSLTIRCDALSKPLKIPATSLREVWRGSADQIKQAKALPLESGPEDAAFVMKDNSVVAVRGVTMGIEGESLRFKFQDQERKIALAKLVGVILGGTEPRHDRSFHQTVQLVGENTVSGKWIGFDAKRKSISLTTAWSENVEIPLTSLYKLRSANGRLTYLSDVKPSVVDQVAYFDRLMPYRINQSLTGGPIKLIDGDYPHGISVHARCVLTYDLDGEYSEFKTKVGFLQPEGKIGQANLRVIGDGKTLWESLDARGDAPKPADISLKIDGVKQLVLEADFGKNGDTGARIAWANPRLLRAAVK